MDKVKVVFRDMPCDIGGYTVESIEDGDYFYTVIINAKLSAERQRAAYLHEIDHIKERDFEKVRELGGSIVEHNTHGRIGGRP